MPGECGQILENYFLLFIPPNPIQYPSPSVFYALSFMSIYLHTLGFQHLQWEFTGLMLDWVYHVNPTRSCPQAATEAAAFNTASHTPSDTQSPHPHPRQLRLFRGSRKGWDFGVKNGTFWPDWPLMLEHIFWEEHVNTHWIHPKANAGILTIYQGNVDPSSNIILNTAH